MLERRRLQSIPDWVAIEGLNMMELENQVGNAVSVWMNIAKQDYAVILRLHKPYGLLHTVCALSWLMPK